MILPPAYRMNIYEKYSVLIVREMALETAKCIITLVLSNTKINSLIVILAPITKPTLELYIDRGLRIYIIWSVSGDWHYTILGAISHDLQLLSQAFYY